MSDPYRSSDLVNAPPPGSLVALIWRWLLLRRADRIDREEKKSALQLEARNSQRVTIHMRRETTIDPFVPFRVNVTACPGKSAPRPENVNHHDVRDYWLCSADWCCCEVGK